MEIVKIFHGTSVNNVMLNYAAWHTRQDIVYEVIVTSVRLIDKDTLEIKYKKS